MYFHEKKYIFLFLLSKSHYLIELLLYPHHENKYRNSMLIQDTLRMQFVRLLSNQNQKR